jgi:CheY-like chemotaxis protein
MKNKVLVIEDEENIANAFKKQLTILGGFEVDTANGGGEGLKKLSTNQYDIALLDIVMPDIDGLDVLQTVRSDEKKYKQIPIIALTNVTADDAKKNMQNAGVTDYIVKTNVEPEQLIKAIKDCIE